MGYSSPDTPRSRSRSWRCRGRREGAEARARRGCTRGLHGGGTERRKLKEADGRRGEGEYAGEGARPRGASCVGSGMHADAERRFVFRDGARGATAGITMQTEYFPPVSDLPLESEEKESEVESPSKKKAHRRRWRKRRSGRCRCYEVNGWVAIRIYLHLLHVFVCSVVLVHTYDQFCTSLSSQSVACGGVPSR